MLRKYPIEILVVLVLHLAFLAFQLVSENYFTEDSAEYIQTADNLIHEGILYSGDLDAELETGLYTKRLPGYTAVLAAIQWFTSSPLPLLILQLLFSMTSFLILLRMFKPGKMGRIVLMILVLLFPLQFIYANLYSPEILFQVVIMGCAVFIFKYIQQEQIWVLWFYQALFILSILIEPLMYMFVVPNFILFIILYSRTKQRLVLISSLIPVVFLIILGGVNQHRTGYFHISSIQEHTLVDGYMFLHQVEIMGEDAAHEARDLVHQTCDLEIDFKGNSQCLSASAKEYFREDLVSYGLFHLKGAVWLFLDPGLSEISAFFNVRSQDLSTTSNYWFEKSTREKWDEVLDQPVWLTILLLLIFAINILRLAGFVIFIFNWKIRISFRILLLLLVGFLALAAGPRGSAPFLIPVFFLVTGAATIQYARWLSLLRKGRE
jgi:hypothetical protein